jgi:hypothetical protein
MLAVRLINGHNNGMTKPDLRIDDLRAMLEAAYPNSKLGRWFTAHRAEFDDLLTTIRPRWEARALKFAEEGLIVVPATFWAAEDTQERRLARKRAGEAARQVWQRVKRRPIRACAPASTTFASPAKSGRSSAPGIVSAFSPELADHDEFRPVRKR